MIKITQEHSHSAVARQLIAGLNEAIWVRYPEMRPGEDEAYKQGNLLAADTLFFVAWLDGAPVGCGAYRPLGDAIAEIKRMYVADDARRKGVGQAILQKVEQAACEAGYRVARLETGTAQWEAIALYEKAGYVRIPCWPPYDGLSISICMEKNLVCVS